MRTAYRVLAYLVALEVVVQAAAIAFAVFGLSAWMEAGGVLDRAAMESDTTSFTGVTGFMIHGMNGQVVMPVIALALLVVSFFAHVPRGVTWGATTFGLVVVQVLLGMFAHGLPVLGMLHGVVALGILAVAIMAGHAASSAPTGAARERVAA